MLSALMLTMVLAAEPTRSDPLPVPTSTCAKTAQAVLEQVAELSNQARWRKIRKAFQERPELACGLPVAEVWTAKPTLPEGCTWWGLEKCPFTGGIALKRAIIRDADDDVFVRAQRTAILLRQHGKLSPQHERLITALIEANSFGNAKEPEEDSE